LLQRLFGPVTLEHESHGTVAFLLARRAPVRPFYTSNGGLLMGSSVTVLWCLDGDW